MDKILGVLLENANLKLNILNQTHFITFCILDCRERLLLAEYSALTEPFLPPSCSYLTSENMLFLSHNIQVLLDILIIFLCKTLYVRVGPIT